MRLPIYGGEEGEKISPSPPSAAAAAAAARELASYNPISLGGVRLQNVRVEERGEK